MPGPSRRATGRCGAHRGLPGVVGAEELFGSTASDFLCIFQSQPDGSHPCQYFLWRRAEMYAHLELPSQTGRAGHRSGTCLDRGRVPELLQAISRPIYPPSGLVSALELGTRLGNRSDYQGCLGNCPCMPVTGADQRATRGATSGRITTAAAHSPSPSLSSSPTAVQGQGLAWRPL
jgi:hypothetical protein